MKLRRLRLENFRQFRGQQEIAFSVEPDRNVTVLWGANGAGKTTLLNAFTWVLYGAFTKDFEKAEELCNIDQWSALDPGSRISVAVELEFDHESQLFTLRRESTYRKSAEGQQILEHDAESSLDYTDETGRRHSSGNPDDHIKQLLPERLHSFFFFNGERIEHLVQPSAYEEIEDAIKTILGLTEVERAIRHLPKVAKEFEKVLRKHGSDEQREITKALDGIDDEVSRTQVGLERSQRDAAQYQEEMDLVSEQLRGTEMARELQRERDSLLRRDTELDEELQSIEQELDEVLRARGFLAPGIGLFDRIISQFEVKRERKELPAPVKRDFIDDLLQDGVCICGASLAEGTPGHEHIEDWRQRAGMAEVEQRWNELHAQAGSLAERREELRAELDRLLTRRDSALGNRKLVGEQLSEVSSKLKNGASEDVQELENARAAWEQRKDDEIREQGRLSATLDRLREDRSTWETKLKRVESGIAEAELAKRRLSVSRQALETLEKIYEIRTEGTRSELDTKIKQIYRGITFKPYIPEVKQDFHLALLHADSGEPVAKSTGENQILSLSFVGALAAIARARYEQTRASRSRSVGARGGIYPIVMDAAFGSLDENYRKEVSTGLPGLAEQIVIMVSKSGGDGAVDHLQDSVGRSYVIQYRTTRDDVRAESISIDGVEHRYVDISDDGAEYAEIVEV